MDRSTTVLLNDLEDEEKSRTRTQQDFALTLFRQLSTEGQTKRIRSSTSILRRSISDSVERNLCYRVGLHQACREGIVDVVKALLQSHVPTINTLDEEGFAPLHYAARYDRVEIVQLLVDAGAGGDDKCTSPLHAAARFNSPGTAKLLVSSGADIFRRSDYGQYALHYAARRGNADVVKVLLEEGTIHPDVTDNENSTPLHAASQAGKLNAVEILLEHRADPGLSDNDGYTAVHVAAKEGHDEVLEKLLYTARNDGVSCSAILNKMDNDTNSCLHLAVQHGHIKAAEVCIKYGADTCAIQEDLATPLHVASVNGHYEMAKLLVINGAGIQAEDADGMTPILRASLAGSVKIIDLLLKEGADISTLDLSCSPSPLMCAVKRGHHAAVKFLLDKGSPIDLRDMSRRTCLHVAVYSNDMDTLRIIIQAGGECLLNSKDKNDKTPLHYAATKGNLQIVQELLAAGAALDIKDEDEKIPLHYAVENGDLSCVRILVEAFPDSINATDFLLRNSLHFAASNGRQVVIKYLLDQGVAVDSRDDERLTPLIQAARCGCHISTGALLDRGAKIDATDKNGCTALMIAASQGKVHVVKLLLNRGASMELLSTDGRHCLEAAILNGHQDVCMEIAKHQRWEEAFSFQGQNGFIPLKSLIQTFPAVAKVVMDKCIQSSSHFITDEEYSVTFDFKYVNPDPVPGQHNKAHLYFAPKTILDYGRKDLIFHPLTIELMKVKRKTIGVRFFYASALIYMLYLANLTWYLCCVQGLHLTDPTDEDPIFTANKTCVTANVQLWEIVLSVATGIFLLIEVYQAYTEKWNYIETSNVVEVCTFTTALLALLSDRMGMALSSKWLFLVVSLLFGYLTLLLYLQSVFDAGVHVTMLFVVVKTLAKVTIMFAILIFSFAIVFQLLLSKRVNASALNLTRTEELKEEIKQDPFGSLELSIIKVLAMTIGEIEYTRFFTDQELFSPTLSRLVFVAFSIMMPIVLMNLTIGLAVGDIDSIQQNAEYKRLCFEIETMVEFKEKLPLWLLHRLHQSKSVRRPNKKAKSVLERIKGIGNKIISGNAKYAASEDSEDKAVDLLSRAVMTKMKEQDKKISSFCGELREQRALLEKMHKIICKIGENDSLSDD